MLRIQRVGMILIAFALGGASTAFADGYREILGRCGGTGFQTCASVSVRVTGVQVKIRIQNLSGTAFGGVRGGVFKSITVSNIPTSVAAGLMTTTTGPSYSGVAAPVASSWRTTSAPSGSVKVMAAAGDNIFDNGVASGCATVPSNLVTGTKTNLWMTPGCGSTSVANSATNGGWVEITFTTNVTWDPTNVRVTLTAVNLELPSAPVETWEMCPGGVCSPGDVTPEPASVLLLGTGLGAMFLRMRRRRAEIETDRI